MLALNAQAFIGLLIIHKQLAIAVSFSNIMPACDQAGFFMIGYGLTL